MADERGVAADDRRPIAGEALARDLTESGVEIAEIAAADASSVG
ncbi:MAG: hypothetical protein R3A51_11905 [Nannocystaceae bacterium]